ncbi:hypothetical protein AYB33_04485 [Leptospira santarosai]|nr:hypothetical protein LEP1GSC039_1278 [Leptospira santarosai str. 2000027870]KXZ30286.1 hypothetical protein AYB33_04485 [Leptospira santarosai]
MTRPTKNLNVRKIEKAGKNLQVKEKRVHEKQHRIVSKFVQKLKKPAISRRLSSLRLRKQKK